MNFYVDFSQLFTLLLALVGWFVVHRLNAKRDLINHKRDMQTDYLIKAFQLLANSANRPFEPGAQHLKDIECSLANIQLFGSKKQVQLVEDFTNEFAKTNSASLDPLLNSLRQDLRKELGYDLLNGNIKWVRFEGGVNTEQHRVTDKFS